MHQLFFLKPKPILMKTILAAMILLTTAGCANLRQAQQVDMIKAEVIRIDTLYRHPGNIKQLTWKDKNNMEYISFVSIYNQEYTLGSNLYVMRKR